MTTPLATTENGALAPSGGAAAMAMQLRASVEARALLAQRFPRNMDQVRQDLLHECQRPRFADVAIYRKPMAGSAVVGPSVRFAEACLQHMPYLDCDVLPLDEDADTITLIVAAIDWQQVSRVGTTIRVRKEVIRTKAPKDKSLIVATRFNSKGKLTYVIKADEEAMRPKLAAEISKAMRTTVLRLVPGWLVDECLDKIHEVRRAGAAEDRDAYRHKVVDGFASLGVRAASLEQYLGHDLGEASPDELLELRAIYQGIRGGHIIWQEAMHAKHGEVDDDEGAAARDQLLSDIAVTKDRLAGRAPREQQPEPAAQPKPAKARARKPPQPPAAAEPEAEPEAEPTEALDSGAKQLAALVAERAELAAKLAAELNTTPEVVIQALAAHKNLPELVAQGFEIDPATGELVPPAGGGLEC